MPGTRPSSTTFVCARVESLTCHHPRGKIRCSRQVLTKGKQNGATGNCPAGVVGELPTIRVFWRTQLTANRKVDRPAG